MTEIDDNSCADAILDVLHRAGVRHIFGFPGESSLPLYLALQRSGGRVAHVLARCPRCAGYMADAYARVSGKVGICDAPGGIGSPFVTPALHEARNSSVPLILLASGTARKSRDSWTTSRCDQQALFRPITKQTFLVEDAAQVATRCAEALSCATSPRLGPVLLEIPSDIFDLPAPNVMPIDLPAADYPASRPLDQGQLARMVDHLRGEESLVILAGGGVHLSHSASRLLRLAETLGLPVATTLNGKGVIPEDHPLALGVAGAKGHATTNALINQAGCVLVLGSKLGDKSTNYGSLFSDRQLVVHVDHDPEELHPRAARYLPVCGDVGSVLEAIWPLLAGRGSTHWVGPERPPFWPPGPTSMLCDLLTRHLPEGSIVVSDASVASGWAGAAIQLNRAGQRLLAPRGSGSIGFALPAAIGAKVARPDAPVVALGGDGGFAMAMHEMETAVRHRLPLLYLLLNNQRLGLIDKHARDRLGGREISGDFHDIRWVDAAQAFGWKAECVRDGRDLARRLPGLIRTDWPTLIDYRIPMDELAPDYILTNRRDGRA